MSTNTRVIVIGNTNLAKIQFTIIQRLSNRQIEAIARTAAKTLRDNIRASITRSGSTDHLALAFTVEQLDSTGSSWGVGRITTLNKIVPYWAWINYGRAGTGRTIPPGTDENQRIRGTWTGPNGRFIKGPPWFPMNPKKAIQPHNFIQKTINQHNQIISSVLANIK